MKKENEKRQQQLQKKQKKKVTIVGPKSSSGPGVNLRKSPFNDNVLKLT